MSPRQSIAAAVLLPLYMVADTCITLVRRVINKEPFLSAHRSHYYQRAVTEGRSVPQVTTRIFLHGLALAMLAIGVALSQSPLLDFVALALGVFSTTATLRLARARPKVKRTVLVTGASGFIGRSLVGALAGEGYAVKAAARDPEAVPPAAGVTRVALPDLARPVDWSDLLAGVSHVVHLAGLAHSPGVLADDVYRRINALAAGELAEAASRAKVERLVFVSSVRAQAGLSADHKIAETDVPAPTDAYGRSKLEAEQLIEASGAGFTVLRPAVVYGPGVKGNIASLATLAKTPMPLPFANLDNRRSLLAIENFIAAILLALRVRARGERNLPRRRCRAHQRGEPGRRHA